MDLTCTEFYMGIFYFRGAVFLPLSTHHCIVLTYTSLYIPLIKDHVIMLIELNQELTGMYWFHGLSMEKTRYLHVVNSTHDRFQEFSIAR